MRILSFLSRLKLNQLLHISRFKALIAKSFFFVICSFFQDGVEDGSFFGGSEQLDQEKRQIQMTPAQLYFDFHKYSHHLSCISIFTNTDDTPSLVFGCLQVQTPAETYFNSHKCRHQLSCISIFTNTDDTPSPVFGNSQVQTPADTYFNSHKYRRHPLGSAVFWFSQLHL